MVPLPRPARRGRIYAPRVPAPARNKGAINGAPAFNPARNQGAINGAPASTRRGRIYAPLAAKLLQNFQQLNFKNQGAEWRN